MTDTDPDRVYDPSNPEHLAWWMEQVRRKVESGMELPEGVTLAWDPPLPRRCKSEACDECDGVHSYGDGCAMTTRPEPKVPAEVIDALYHAGRRMLDIELAMASTPSPFRDGMPARQPSPDCYEASFGWVHSRPSCRCR